MSNETRYIAIYIKNVNKIYNLPLPNKPQEVVDFVENITKKPIIDFENPFSGDIAEWCYCFSHDVKEDSITKNFSTGLQIICFGQGPQNNNEGL